MRTAATIIAMLALMAIACDAQLRPQRPIAIFNGKGIDGWAGDPALWSVVDGVLTGTTSAAGDQKIEQNSFLIYQGSDVEDFELTVEARVTGENNSGLQYRSRIVDPSKHIVSGYQLDIHPRKDLVGMVYEERGRGILARRGSTARARHESIEVVGALDASETIDIGGWNEYKVVARGSHLTHKINGKNASILIDQDAEKRSLKGSIALQLHAGAPMKLEVRKIVLRRLNRTSAAPTARPNTKPLAKQAEAQWISPKTKPKPEEAVYFRRGWRRMKSVEKATLSVAASQKFEIYLDGEKVGGGDGSRTPFRFDVATKLHTQALGNFLAIRVAPGDDPSLAVQIDFEHRDAPPTQIVSDRSWLSLAAQSAPENWTGRPSNPLAWKESNSAGSADDLFEVAAEQKLPRRHLTTLPGFKLEKIHEAASDQQGPWIALTAGDDGQLFASAQNGGIYRFTPGAGGTLAVAQINLDIDHTSGLLWAFGSLFAIVNHPGKSGLYRLDDRDSDGNLDQVITLRRFAGSGEQGPHGITLGPEPQSLYIACGSQTELPDQFGRQRPSRHWGDDQLLRATPTAGASLSPGGWIAMTRPGGVEWELHSIGWRNPSDLAFNRHGDLFIADSDPPSFAGSASFRPTSVYHVPPGADGGAREPGKHFPGTYPDSLPPVAELSPGSPTGVSFGYGAAFPARYQEALFVGDSTTSTIQAIHLRPVGSSYQATSEEFIAGPDLRITDITISSDGSMYFTTGGETSPSALWRVNYSGDEPTTPTRLQPFSPEIERQQALLDKLGKLQGLQDPRALATAWEQLDHPDRLVRQTARTVIEHFEPESWLVKFNAETAADATIEASVALARSGTTTQQPTVFDKLGAVDFPQLSNSQKIAYLRAHALAFIRLASPTDEQKSQLIDELSPTFPSRYEPLDLELSRMLIYLASAEALAPSLRLLNSTKSHESALAYATFLSHAKDGWTPEAKANYLAWLRTARLQPGSDARKTYLDRLETAFLRGNPVKNE
ncbi:MAG: glucose/arabinose dehydrogenase [Pseudoalteromonas tetraodonis]|jgi:glucose/arabinose dehydrogenase